MSNMYDEKETVEQLTAANKVLLEMVKTQKMNVKSIVKVFIVTVACYTALLISMVIGFFWYESQFETEYTKETITQEVSGEGSNINNVEGDQYNDNATHNE